jgi:hypothetical protein
MIPIEEINCPKCNGDGYTSEHDPRCNGTNCLHLCPIQVQCEFCQATGKIKIIAPALLLKWIDDKIKEVAEQKKETVSINGMIYPKYDEHTLIIKRDLLQELRKEIQ